MSEMIDYLKYNAFPIYPLLFIKPKQNLNIFKDANILHGIQYPYFENISNFDREIPFYYKNPNLSNKQTLTGINEEGKVISEEITLSPNQTTKSIYEYTELNSIERI